MQSPMDIIVKNLVAPCHSPTSLSSVGTWNDPVYNSFSPSQRRGTSVRPNQAPRVPGAAPGLTLTQHLDLQGKELCVFLRFKARQLLFDQVPQVPPRIGLFLPDSVAFTPSLGRFINMTLSLPPSYKTSLLPPPGQNRAPWLFIRSNDCIIVKTVSIAVRLDGRLPRDSRGTAGTRRTGLNVEPAAW